MASRRLTKQLREAFVRAVMNDVPAPGEETATKELQKILEQHMPDAVFAAYMHDSQWIETHCFTVLTTSWRSSLYLRVKWRSNDFESLPQEARAYIAKLQQLMDERVEFEGKLKGAVEACSTVKSLVSTFPELEKYAPDDVVDKKKGLPVVANLMAEAVRRGWPGGKIINAEIVQGA